MAERSQSQNFDKNKIQMGISNRSDETQAAAPEEVPSIQQPSLEGSVTQPRADIPQVEMGRKKVDDMRFMITCTNWY
ncbi:hypothetical protein XENTR_v10007854 [Xenopus tropicalis]|nr:hypothetical protein XENTR_v10007854 [Xenopus tropicalis]